MSKASTVLPNLTMAHVKMARKAHIRQLLLLLAAIVMVTVAPPATADDNPGTTEHIQTIFLGRCFDYKQIQYKSVLPPVAEPCGSLYEKFLEAFSSRPPCAVDMDRYGPFIEAAKQTIPHDKAMFWSGVKELAHEYASEGERYVTLEDTLIGYVVDGMVWCGQSTPPGMNFTRCPSWNDCPSEASEAFWGSASKAFAQSARGEVTLMLDASRPDRPAYRRDSFFGKYELPSMDTSLVTGVMALLTHPLDTPGYETCETGSMVLLEQDVTSHGLAFSCVDDPDAILHLLCVEDPSDKACHMASKSMFKGSEDESDDDHPSVLNSKPKNRFDSINNPTG